jgi:anti-anti-sigma factor
MDMTRQDRGSVAVLALTGRLDTVTAPDFDRQWEENVGAEDLKVVLDMAGLEYVSSAGLRSLLMAGKKMKRAGGKLAVAGLKGMVAEVFTISGFDKLLPLYADTDAAVADLES